MDLPTYTNIWRIEKRLYKLYDLRLPMPLPIVWIGVFVGVFIPWSLLLILVGVPVAMPWHVLFLVPPGIVTWLSTRPVIEGKRLTELLESHLRYLGEPKAWCRLAPMGEPETVTFSARVWRIAPARAKSKRPGKSRQPRRRREDQRIAGPRQVRPAVAAAAAAAGQAPVAEPAAAGTGWGARRGAAAPALKAQARQPAPGTAPPPPRLEREPAGQRDNRKTDTGRDFDRTDTGRDADRTDTGRDGARTDTGRDRARKDGGRRAGAKGTSGWRLSTREGAIREAATQQAALREAALREAALREAALREVATREVATSEVATRDAATRDAASREAATREAASREAATREAASREVATSEVASREVASREVATREAATREVATREAVRGEIAGEETSGRESVGRATGAPETAAHAGTPAAEDAATSSVAEVGAVTGAEPVDDVATALETDDHEVASSGIRSHEDAGRESGTAQSGKPSAGKPIDTEALRRLRRLAASADAPADAPADTAPDTAAGRRKTAGRAEGGRREEQVARDQHRKGQPPRLGPALVLSGTQRVWPPLNPNAKPLPRPGASGAPAAAGDAPSEGAETRRPGVPADEPGRPSASTGAGDRPRLTPVPSDSRATAGETAAGDRTADEEQVAHGQPASAGEERTAHEQPAWAGEERTAHGQPASAGEQAAVTHDPIGGRVRGGAGAVDGLVGPVPRPGETRVRRVESVIGRDSGGWRRIAQVVVGGNNVRTDGSEIDEARARAVFSGSRRIVVLGCTGGAGQSTTALMLGHTFATYRDDRVVAVDANTGGTTLTSRIQPETPETLTSLLSGLDRVSGYLTMRGYTTRTASGLEVISADTDAGAEQRLADRSFFSDHRLGESMRLLERHYKLAVIDPAAALAARLLPYADQLVLVVPASEEAPEAVGMTYEWLDGHGCAELRRRAVMVVNGVSRRSMADVEQAESVARGRCRAIVRVPWEDDLAPGGAEIVDPGQLRAAGRRAYLALAGVVVAGFAAQTVRPSEEELASDPPGTRIGER
ncbi:TcpE family conjugal transfer membrane protein [Nonomuraea sp. NBC_00507]|uniref:TcpE family conjugal transfer membrane protein n=1 Tax=Nonomuraea sp. NBC_00507 TaxID=2976002 RepID=UPI002E18A124